MASDQETRPPEGRGDAEETLLLVDDDPHVLRSLGRILARPGRVVTACADGAEALRHLERSPVQVVLCDYRMPGMDGVELLNQVKERWPGVQRILVTGQADTTAIEEAVNRSEIFRFVWKPWDEGHLQLTVQDALDRHRTEAENRRLQGALASRQWELERLNRELDSKLGARTRALQRAAEEWRATFDAIADPLAIVRDRCEVVRANAGFARKAGVPLESLAGLRCQDHAFGNLPCPGTWTEAAPEQVVPHAGREWQLRSFPFGEGAVVVVYKDVTRERQVTRRLFQAEKMSALGQLAGGVAHEINNPLGGILAFAQIMAQDPRSAEDQESLRLISDAALRAKRIVESLLRFSRTPREDERGPVDLSRVVQESLAILQPTLRGGRLAVESDLRAAVTVGNANQLQQVVVNLIVNAAQAIPDRGTIRIQTGPGAPGRVVVSVADDGPGVPPEIAGRIFEPFFTTKPEGQGTGLGLSICYRIAEEHHGTIALATPSGGGASFVVDLPAAPPQ